MNEYTIEKKKLGPFFAVYNANSGEVLCDFEKNVTEEWDEVSITKKGNIKIKQGAFSFKSERKAKRVIKYLNSEYSNKKNNFKVIKFFNLKKTVCVDYLDVEIIK